MKNTKTKTKTSTHDCRNLGGCPECYEDMDYGDLAPRALPPAAFQSEGAWEAHHGERIKTAAGEGALCDVCAGYVDAASNADLAEVRGTTTAAITAAATATAAARATS